LIALVLTVVLLEWQSRSMTGQKKQKAAVSKRLLWLIYIPMLVPQVSFLFGIQVLVIGLGLEGNFAVLIWSHLLFVLPYSYLSLSQVYLRYDNRYLQLAEILSGSRLKSLFKIKLLMLLKPLAFSFAVGFSVSVTQYLPSLYVGAGRVSTLTLETVALATGSDDRVTSVFSLWQFALPLIVYILAIAIPRFYFRHCKGM
jgi:putative thiamine transport system permease protein